jgi:superfamily II DNA helicase RecQ
MNVQYASFNLPPHPGSEEAAELNRFLRSHAILQCQTAFSHESGGRWMILVQYGMGTTGSEGDANHTRRAGKVDYKTVLSPEDFELFDRLRRVRKALAEADGLPVYAICTNEQLSRIATTRPGDKAAFQSIEGLGEAKTERYAAEFIKAVLAS